MARDYTKYQVKGLGENLNKRQLAFEIVKDYVDKNNPSYDELTSVFKDDVQGNKGFISKLANVKDPKRFNVKMPLKIKFGVEVVVSNQWGSKNIDALLNLAKHLNYTITVENKEVDKKPEEETSSHSSKSNDADLNSYTLIRAYTTENTNEDLQLNKCIVFHYLVMVMELSILGIFLTQKVTFMDKRLLLGALKSLQTRMRSGQITSQ